MARYKHTAEEILGHAEDRLNVARAELGNARDWLVGADVEMTDKQRARLRWMLAGIGDAKEAIDVAKRRS